MSTPDRPKPRVREEKPVLEPGAMVGRYRSLKKLGVGSMGEVYLAEDESLGRRVAIKLLGTKHLGNATVRERFLREARALARLAHPNLITVFESGHIEEADRPYFAMELLEGGDTHKLLDERGPLPSGVVALIGAQAAAGLGEAARAGIIHRDVKPSNLGISRHGVLKVTDFSLAKSDTTEKSLTGKGMVVGTADYIAPEQARGEDVDERADIYSLGCTLFHLLTGKPPFRCEEGTQMQRYVDVMRAHLTAPVPDPRNFAPNIDGELARLIADMMDKDRERRPTSEELAPALARLAGRLGGDLPRVSRRLFTVPTEIPVASVAAGAARTTEPAPSGKARTPQRHMPWSRVAAAAAVLLVAIAIALALVLR